MKISLYGAMLALCVAVLCGQSLLATPQNNIFDTQPIYTMYGMDKFFKAKDKGEIRFHLSPFYQQASTVRDNDGKKVPAGDRLGEWNLFGVFFGLDGIPTGKTLNDFFNLSTAKTDVGAITTQQQGDASLSPSTFSRYRSGPTNAVGPDITDEVNFQPDKYTFAYVSQPLEYEKIGVRSQFNFDFGFGLGIAVKGGVVDAKQAPSNFVFEPQFMEDRTNPATAIEGTVVPTAHQQEDANALYDKFYAPAKFKLVANDLDLDLTTYHKTGFEDVLLQLYWHVPIDLKDKTGDVVVTMVPYLSAGSWLPISEERDHTKPFSVSVGNDGYYGLVAEASLAFDFPVSPQDQKDERTFQVCLGGGIVGFSSKNEKNVRMYSHDYQLGVVPWKTIITRRPGLIWYLNTSMKAENFIDGLSFYIDYIYTQHLTDDITLLESDSKRKAAFEGGLDRFVRETAWKNQQVNVGFDYQVAPALFIGAAAQGHISGTRVYRATTLMAGVTLKL